MRLVPLLMGAALLGTAAAQAFDGPTYKWVDVTGRVHYGDVPPPTADWQEVVAGECDTKLCQRDREQEARAVARRVQDIKQWLEARERDGSGRRRGQADVIKKRITVR